MAAKRIPELDMAIKWKTFYDILSEKALKEETDKAVVAAIFCIGNFPTTYDTAVRWKALCDILKKEPFKIDSPKRGVIAALILLATKKHS